MLFNKLPPQVGGTGEAAFRVPQFRFSKQPAPSSAHFPASVALPR
jgi:hypothetical protein